MQALALTLIEPAAYWLVAEEDESARSVQEYLAACAGRESPEEFVAALASHVDRKGAAPL